MKRFGRPRAKAGELKIGYGKLADHSPDLIVVNGEGVERANSNWLMHAITSPTYRPGIHVPLGHYVVEKSFVEELEDRGFDITTLKISMRKKNETGRSGT